MRAVVQRVTAASVAVDGTTVSAIGRGLCVLVGITKDDTPDDMDYLVRKILGLRLFDAEPPTLTDTPSKDDTPSSAQPQPQQGKPWRKNVCECGYEILAVSQFTLYAKTNKNKPDFHMAMPGSDSEPFYQDFLDKLKKGYNPDKIKDGVFGAYMSVNIQNDGPVTIILDSNARDPVGKTSKD